MFINSENLNKTKMIFIIFGFLLFLYSYGISQETGEWEIQTVDSSGNIGLHTSIGLDSQDYPQICYYDKTNGDLKYAKWNGISWSSYTIDTCGREGGYCAIAVDKKGYPHISYYTGNSYSDKPEDKKLKYAKFDGVLWTTSTVDQNVKLYKTSITLDREKEEIYISYIVELCRLKYAKWDGMHWSTITVSSKEWRSFTDGTTVVLDSNNFIHILSLHDSMFRLKYVKQTSLSWQMMEIPYNVHDDASVCKEKFHPSASWRYITERHSKKHSDADEVFTNDIRWSASLDLDSQNNSNIACLGTRVWIFGNTNWELRYMRFKFGDTTATLSLVDKSGLVGLWNSIKVDSNDIPHISYCDFTFGDLKYAKWNGFFWDIERIDTEGDTGWYTSLALDSKGYPHISYYDNINGDLKYAKKTLNHSIKKNKNSFKKEDIAILEFTATEVSKEEALIASDNLRDEFVNLDNFNVLDKENMIDILKEQQFQHTGCTDPETAAKIGKILNVDKIIIGNLTAQLYGEEAFKVNYKITVKILNVNSSKVIFEECVRFKQADELTPLMYRLSKRIVGGI